MAKSQAGGFGETTDEIGTFLEASNVALDFISEIGQVTRTEVRQTDVLEVGPHMLVGGTDYEYDAAGNLTKDDTHYYYWDYENRLTKVELVDGGADVAAYTYDANNRRVEKLDYTADPDETTQYFYDSWSCIEEREDDGTLLATYINGPRIDEYILMNRDSADYWYMQSPIVGNVAALVNSSGEIQEGYKYRAYGEATVLTGPGNDTTWFTSDDDTATISAIANPFTFTGRRLDPETMLMYFRWRMYRTDDGSFISHDPIGYVDGMSLYLGYFAPSMRDSLGLIAELDEDEYRKRILQRYKGGLRDFDTFWRLSMLDYVQAEKGWRYNCKDDVEEILAAYLHLFRDDDGTDGVTMEHAQGMTWGIHTDANASSVSHFMGGAYMEAAWELGDTAQDIYEWLSGNQSDVHYDTAYAYVGADFSDFMDTRGCICFKLAEEFAYGRKKLSLVIGSRQAKNEEEDIPVFRAEAKTLMKAWKKAVLASN